MSCRFDIGGSSSSSRWRAAILHHFHPSSGAGEWAALPNWHGAIVHSSDKALIVLSTNDVDFWEDDQVSLINQEEEMKVWEVYEDFEVPERPSLLVLSPLKNPSAVTPIDINVNQINPGEMLAAVGFEKIGSKRLSSGQLIGEVRKYGVSMLEPRECAGLPHVRSSSFVFDHSANMCVENAATVGTAFVEDASGGPLLVKRERDGRDYLVGLTPSDGPAGVFVNIAEHAGWLRFALGEILDPTEEAYDDEDEDEDEDTYEYA